ncbi:MAG: restriction system-associated AAA family ATPase [Sphingobium sp.]|nr:restriction system-associated AAA family ATPase [Sphingobium sp.]
MKILSVEIGRSDRCGGILDGLELYLREEFSQDEVRFEPVCLIGRNGTGKSQFLQTLAEIFQTAWHACAPAEERQTPPPSQAFSLEYLIWPGGERVHVRLSRSVADEAIDIETLVDGEWVAHLPSNPETAKLLPRRIIGYTSGENETLSVPFFASRSGYAQEVTNRALLNDAAAAPSDGGDPLEPRLMLIDYGTHLELLVANLLLGTVEQRSTLLEVAALDSLRSVRCVIQLASGRTSASGRRQSGRKGVQLTDELETYIANLKACSTCWDYEEAREIYTFDYWCDAETSTAFRSFFDSAFELYRALHKLALLNDLAISRSARRRFERAVSSQRFAARLPEPPDEDKVFRFEQVTFRAGEEERIVDYVSLSDGEHQLVEILGVFAMIGESNVLFLLDEPESHFNPQWRVAFMDRLRSVPTADGPRSQSSSAAAQEVVLTTHAPFVPSDMPRENVVIFERVDGKVRPRAPEIETYGASFDQILEHCFRVEPPISDIARKEIQELMVSKDESKIEAAVPRLGASVEKVLLLDHLRKLKS